MLFLDRTFTLVLAALLIFTPIAVGSVYPWTFMIMEVAAFSLSILWSVRVIASADSVAKPISNTAS